MGYNPDEIENGKIKGEVPTYIKTEDSDEFRPVTEMRGTFNYAVDLVTAPKIPHTVLRMENTFIKTEKLSTLEIPENVIYINKLLEYSENVLTNISVDKNNKVFDSRNNCNAIIETATNKLIQGCKNTIIPSDIITIGDYAFDKCTELTSINLPTNITTIGDYAFNACTKLASINIPEQANLTTIGRYAFSACNALKHIYIPKRVTFIDNYAFSWSGLESINLQANISRIYFATFWYCDSLKSIIIPDGVECIERDAFHCASLESITIPSSVKEINNGAFEDCPKLTTVNYLGTEEQFALISISDNNTPFINANKTYQNQ